MGKDHFKIVVLHNYPCKNKVQLLWEERRIQEEIPKEKSLNQLRSIITNDEHEEWFEQNKDHLKKRSRVYYEKNKTQVNIQNKENYIRNREQRLAQYKEYRIKHKNDISEKQKEYYKKNKEQLQLYYKKYYENTKWLHLYF